MSISESASKLEVYLYVYLNERPTKSKQDTLHFRNTSYYYAQTNDSSQIRRADSGYTAVLNAYYSPASDRAISVKPNPCLERIPSSSKHILQLLASLSGLVKGPTVTNDNTLANGSKHPSGGGSQVSGTPFAITGSRCFSRSRDSGLQTCFGRRSNAE